MTGQGGSSGMSDHRIIPEKETAVAAGRAGVDLDFDDTWTMHMENLERTSANKPSMLHDIGAERQTQIEAISGGVLKYSFDDQEFPYTRSIYALLKAIDFSCTRSEDCRMGKSGTLSASGGKNSGVILR
jgi:ketopantoate reductase